MSGKGDLAKLDVAVLTADQQEKLRQFKIKTRINNEKYLRSHPEVERCASKKACGHPGFRCRSLHQSRPSCVNRLQNGRKHGVKHTQQSQCFPFVPSLFRATHVWQRQKYIYVSPLDSVIVRFPIIHMQEATRWGRC